MTIDYKLYRKYYLKDYELFLTKAKFILKNINSYEEGIPVIKNLENHLHFVILNKKTFLFDLKEQRCFTNFIGELNFE
jgi:hypothetical protein